MMPKKAPDKKRSIVIGVKIDQITNEKIKYLAEMSQEKLSTYIYNLIQNHINVKEPWISKEIQDMKGAKSLKEIILDVEKNTPSRS